MIRAALLACLILAGCATDPSIVGMALQAQADAAKRPTLELDCPQGCTVRYTDPRDRNLNVRLPTNGWDALTTVSGQVTAMVSGAVPYAAIAGVAVRGLDRAGGNDSSVATTNNQIGPNSQNQSTATTTTTTTTDSHDATATPTIVNQPAPVIVTQPAPVVVRPEIVVTP